MCAPKAQARHSMGIRVAFLEGVQPGQPVRPTLCVQRVERLPVVASVGLAKPRRNHCGPDSLEEAIICMHVLPVH